VSEEVRALRGTLAAAAPPPAVAQAALRAAEESVYTAFENRFRGSREELRKRQAPDADLFRGLGPVADLGCGRGEFLELLRAAGVACRGVDSNRNAVLECREKGFDVVHGDLVDFRARRGGIARGVFAAQSSSTSPRRSCSPCWPRPTARSAEMACSSWRRST
jgi:SAM-dependent methyltransferase